MDTLSDIILQRPPTARRPLLGLTVLVVEDSRFASEAVRQMCLRSGARIRRADSLETARRHLATYLPTVLLVDVGLPDGSGLALMETLATATPRIEAIIGISGDPDAEAQVRATGADGFIAKPISSLLAFQTAILQHLPADRQPPSPRIATDEVINPDPIAYQDDLNHVAQVLSDAEDGMLDYVTQFLGGVARSANDHDLDRAVHRFARARNTGHDADSNLATLSEMVQSRLAAGGPI
ncbi:MAG: response regulator [Pseudomonadota bacterium]